MLLHRAWSMVFKEASPSPRLNSPTSHAPSHDGFEDSPRPSKRQRLAANGSRLPTRPATATGARTTTPRPPTKLSQSAPDGQISQTTNGVRSLLDADGSSVDLLPAQDIKVKRTRESSVRSRTPQGKAEEKRTLRSQDEGARLKSDLSIYFPNYEDVINDAPQDPG